MLPEGKKLWLLTLSRCPVSLRQLLLNGEDLRPCREALAKLGCGVELISGTLAFVRPQTFYYVELVAPAAAALLDVKLQGKHLICSCEFEPLIRQAVGRLRGQDHVRIKGKDQLSAEVALPVTVQRGSSVIFQRFTFLEVSTNRAKSNVTVSTTDARLGAHRNPRRF